MQKQDEDTPQGAKRVRKRNRKKGDADLNPFVRQIKIDENEKIDNLYYVYEVTADSILLQNCQYIVVEKMLMYIECVCDQKIMYIFDATQDRSLKVNIKLQCKKCRNMMLVGI